MDKQNAIKQFDHYLKHDKTKCHDLIRYYKTQTELFKLLNDKVKSKQALDIVKILENKLN